MAEPTNPTDPGTGSSRSRRAYLIQGLVTLLVLVIAVFVAREFLQTAPTAGSRPAPERQARLVEVSRLEPGQYRPTITGWGTLLPSRSLTLQAQVSGAVQALSPRLEPGMTVDAGDELVQLEDLTYAAAVTAAESALAEAEANLALEEGQQAIARREFELLNDDSGAAIWGQQPDSDAPAGLILRKPQLRIAQAAVESARAQLAEARRDLARTTITAPFNALVTERSITLGSQVGPSTTLAQLVGIDTWWVEVLVGADQLAWLADSAAGGEPVPVTLTQPGVWTSGQTRTGRVLRVLHELENQGNLARVLVAVDRPLGADAAGPAAATGPGGKHPRLLLGAFLRADIQGQRLDDVFVLDPRWLREGNTVWVMDADQALEIRPVEVLYRDDQAVVVSAGLTAGEAVVTSRLSTPAEGMPLRTEAHTDSAGTEPQSDSTVDADPGPSGEPSHG